LDFLRELVLKDAIFLLGSRWRENASAKPRRDKPPVKAVVIACNTATAAGLEDIRMAFREWNLPVVVVGVVEAGATGVLDARRKKDTGGTVAVLATVGTCRSGAYPRLIQQAMGQAGRPSLPVIQQGSARLAGIIEGDPAFQQDSLTAVVREDVKALLDGPSDGKKAPPLDLVVLGCTHFPLVRDEIDEAMEYWRNWESKPGLRPYFERVAEKREFVDPAEWTARELFRHLAASRLLSDGKKAVTDKVPAFFVSVPHPKLQAEALTPDASGLSTEYKYGRKPGRLDLEDTVNVPMVPGDLPSHLQKLVQRRLPAVWKRMGSTTP
jgi:glutamate racemase